MWEDTDLAVGILKNPGKLHYLALKELDDRLDGKYHYANPNNGFNFLGEMGSSMFAQITRWMEDELRKQYAVRAESSEDLRNHISDKEYIQMLASPAGTKARILLAVDYLKAKAVATSSDYALAVIPKETVFTIGPRTFSLYYPVSIRINKNTGTIIVSQDATTENPLYSLSSTAVEYVTYYRDGINWLDITLPVWQFNCTKTIETISTDIGYKKTFSYTNSLYAVRIYSYIDSAWSELVVTLSESIYDTSTPTAKLKVYDDTSKIEIQIPQIYFTKGTVGTKIKVEIYTTEGALDIDISETESTQCGLNLNLSSMDDQTYSTVLSGMPTIDVLPTSTRVVGGSNGLAFSELKTRVINGTLYDTVPVTPAQRTAYVQKYGYNLTKYVDNITDRIYFASRTLLDNNEDTVPVTIGTIYLTNETIPNISTVKVDGTIITILPTTLYTFAAATGICTPLTDAEVAVLSAMSKSELVTELNSTVHTKTPYHIVLYADDKYPLAKTYNLMDPAIEAIQFVKENVNSTALFTVNDAAILHKEKGAGGYRLRLQIKKEGAIINLAESDIKIILSTIDKAGRTVYLTATKYANQEASNTYSMELYDVTIPCSYSITQDGYFQSSLYMDETETILSLLPLTTTFNVYLTTMQSALPTVAQDYDIVGELPDYYDDYLGVVQQKITVKFGTDLSAGINNNVDVTWSAQEYAKWPETIYQTYPTDEFERDALDNLVLAPNEYGTLSVVKTHSAGDYVLDGNGDRVIKYAEGSYKYDSSHNLIVSKNRQVIYYIDAMHFDARLYASDTEADVDYTDSITSEVASYVDTCVSIATSILEQHKLYFRPTRTLGNGTFSLGDAVSLSMSLGLSFSYQVYVSSATMKDTKQKELIEETATDITEQYMTDSTISCRVIADAIKAKLGDQIVDIVPLGINGERQYQTLFVAETNASPMVAKKAVYKKDGTIALAKDVSVEFVLVE